MDSQLCRLLELLRTIPDTEFEDEEEDEDEDEYEEEEDEVEEEQEEEGEEEDKGTRGEKGEEAVDNVLNNQRDKKETALEMTFLRVFWTSSKRIRQSKAWHLNMKRRNRFGELNMLKV